MPEDKKAGNQPKEGGAKEEGAGQDLKIAEATTNCSTSARDAHRRQPASLRARNQHVLPGILGKQLRAAYSELLNAPLPETINELVRKLRSKEAAVGPIAADKPPREESGQ